MQSRPTTLLLDTNLLMLLFIGGKDTSLIARAKTLSAFSVEDYDLLIDIIRNNAFVRLITTPHIMTEVSNLLGRERSPIREIGRKAMAEFMDKCVERTDDSAYLVSNPVFERLGLTDVAITVAAEQPAFVLTADVDLYIHMSRLGLPTENFNHIRQGSWESSP